MQKHHKTALACTLVAAVAGAAGTLAHADLGKAENDAMAIASARFSLVQAVAAAEQAANGKASRAEYEHSRQGGIYEVEVVSGAKVFDVRIDADKGTVISSAEDRMDHDDEHGEKD
ncbi:peptidase M4 [Xylophilus rhododendri]|uniref:Peptidase M4 n=1 Tax=Xylophilus rhododendri TaxID=2697032 RepID=A0A857JBV3_9BURK|nr:PepSY domain-containing protein [Xylophilus rhododendri]QHJ00433.1 peptidase M4 [Xylophilus rhododendri]